MPATRSVRRSIAAALAGAGCAALPAIWLRDFMVDDALIPARYAVHLAAGAGYRFNALGSVTDGVTPLGFPYLLAPFAGGGVLAAFTAAKVIGALAWIAAAAVLGVAIDRASESRARFVGLGLVLLSAPLAAWSVAGLETGVVTAIAALGACAPVFGFEWAAFALAGAAAALRPEMLPWALTLALMSAPLTGKSFAKVAIAAAPFAAVAVLRLVIFGRVVPLSVLAKPPSDLLGFVYAFKCLLLTGVVLVIAPRALTKVGTWPRAIAIATAVHLLSVGAAGGDWMPMARLIVPVLPGVALAAAHLASEASPWATATRGVLATAGLVFQAVVAGPSAADVGAARRAVIDEATPALAGAKTVATLDVGWVGAATDATIVDLAGLTDPAIAVLPGGHTSKRLPASLLEARDVDAIVLLVLDGREPAPSWTETYFARVVELTVSEMSDVGARYEVRKVTDVPHLRYLVLRRRPAP